MIQPCCTGEDCPLKKHCLRYQPQRRTLNEVYLSKMHYQNGHCVFQIPPRPKVICQGCNGEIPQGVYHCLGCDAHDDYQHRTY